MYACLVVLDDLCTNVELPNSNSKDTNAQNEYLSTVSVCNISGQIPFFVLFGGDQ